MLHVLEMSSGVKLKLLSRDVRKITLSFWRCMSSSFVPFNFPSQYHPDRQRREDLHKNRIPVCSYNEWDPLEEVIVGRPEGARVPHLSQEVKATIKPGNWKWIQQHQGQPHEPDRLRKAIRQANDLVKILEIEGVKVRRPELINWTQIGKLSTPDFEEGGLHHTCPRDSLLVIGNEIIEATMSWRSRYFETRPYKKLLNEYFKHGAKWTVAPKPTMTDELYRRDYPYQDYQKRLEWCREGKFILTDHEPCFDAADVTRCGKDIFVQISHTTNKLGVQWLQRHLGDEYKVHPLNIEDPYALHMDASFVPLKPGIWLSNPDRPVQQSQAEKIRRAGWKIVEVPQPTKIENNLYTSCWLSMNTLNIDEQRILVYSKEESMIRFLQKYGMKPIPVDFTDCFVFGGGFHCWTLDVRRRGTLESYFDW